MPVHWGKFTLAMHAWNDPVKRVLVEAKNLSVNVITPKIGELVNLGSIYKGDEWWNL